jgi:hypothetical protein
VFYFWVVLKDPNSSTPLAIVSKTSESSKYLVEKNQKVFSLVSDRQDTTQIEHFHKLDRITTI